ncbi:trypco2 family protein [Streptomyces sp. NPDC004232]|uniref:trypco2 family protein n=1 Tax=Streptomyces sp. NPDC004232 TaxID=3154454 RepID=UPI0033ADD72B
MNDVFDELTLAGAIIQVRQELEEALEEGKDQAVRFGVGAVELEFAVEARRVAGGDAGVRFHVVSLGGKAEWQRAQTNRVKVSLEPIDREGEPLKVASSLAHRPDGRQGEPNLGADEESLKASAPLQRRP